MKFPKFLSGFKVGPRMLLERVKPDRVGLHECREVTAFRNVVVDSRCGAYQGVKDGRPGPWCAANEDHLKFVLFWRHELTLFAGGLPRGAIWLPRRSSFNEIAAVGKKTRSRDLELFS